MRLLIKLILFNFISFFLFSTNLSLSQDQEVGEILENIQKDLRTLERAVYSQSFSESTDTNTNQRASTKEAEQALTKHLLKLNDIEMQFQELTNKFEQINFKPNSNIIIFGAGSIGQIIAKLCVYFKCRKVFLTDKNKFKLKNGVKNKKIIKLSFNQLKNRINKSKTKYIYL